MGTKYTSSSSSKVVDAAASAAAVFACFVTWDRAPRPGMPRPVVLGAGTLVASAAGVLFPDTGGDCTSDSTAAGSLQTGGGECTSDTSAGAVDDLARTSDLTAAGLLPTGGGRCSSDTAAGAVDDPASVANAAAVPAGSEDIAGGDEDKPMPAAAIGLRACISRKAINSGVSWISAALKNATVVRYVVSRASASRASELSLSGTAGRLAGGGGGGGGGGGSLPPPLRNRGAAPAPTRRQWRPRRHGRRVANALGGGARRRRERRVPVARLPLATTAATHSPPLHRRPSRQPLLTRRSQPPSPLPLP